MPAPIVSEQEILADRREAEANMIDTCMVTIPGEGKGPFDEATGKYDPPAPVIIYGPGAVDADGIPSTDEKVTSGKCRIQVRADINSNAIEAVVGEHEWTIRTLTMQFPIEGTERIPPDATATILTCPLDGAMVGRVLNLQAETKGKTHASHRRFRAREVAG